MDAVRGVVLRVLRAEDELVAVEQRKCGEIAEQGYGRMRGWMCMELVWMVFAITSCGCEVWLAKDERVMVERVECLCWCVNLVRLGAESD